MDNSIQSPQREKSYRVEHKFSDNVYLIKWKKGTDGATIWRGNDESFMEWHWILQIFSVERFSWYELP